MILFPLFPDDSAVQGESVCICIYGVVNLNVVKFHVEKIHVVNLDNDVENRLTTHMNSLFMRKKKNKF